MRGLWRFEGWAQSLQLSLRARGHPRCSRTQRGQYPFFKASTSQISALNPQPSTLNHSPLNPQPSTLNPQPNPQPSTLNPQPSTLNPQPSALAEGRSLPRGLTSRPGCLSKPGLLLINSASPNRELKEYQGLGGPTLQRNSCMRLRLRLPYERILGGLARQSPDPPP